jgi:hypothetical protein
VTIITTIHTQRPRLLYVYQFIPAKPELASHLYPGTHNSRLDTVRIYAQPDEAALERAAAALEQS